MRAFICNPIGSGTSYTEPLDPADYYQDENGQTVTTRLVDDAVRPVVADQIVGPYINIEVDSRGAGTKMFVLARDVTSQLAQTYDLGDPTDPDDMNRALTAPERNALEQLTGQPNGTFDGFTMGDTFLWFIADGWLVNLPGWAGQVPVTEYPPVTNPRRP